MRVVSLLSTNRRQSPAANAAQRLTIAEPPALATPPNPPAT